MAFQQAGGQRPIPTLAKPQRFNDASVCATTWSLACFIFRFVQGPLLGSEEAKRGRFAYIGTLSSAKSGNSGHGFVTQGLEESR
jgi:hypothetical protein